MFFSTFILGALFVIFLVIMKKKMSKKGRNKSKIKKTKKGKKERFSTKFSVSECNKILVKNDKDCNCFDRNQYPTQFHNECMTIKHSKKCEDYNTCKRKFMKYMSGSEPEYNPEHWEDPVIQSSHNCYAYFLDDHIPTIKKKCEGYCPKFTKKNGKKVCVKKPAKCDDLKPQPGDFAVQNGLLASNKYEYNCDAIMDKVLLDNKDKFTKRNKILKTTFEEKCPTNYYKGAVVVHPDKTYHFYRQDKNARWSHKQGTLKVENVDASKEAIWAPHLADRNYKKNKKEGLNYTNFCSYFCVPSNLHSKTNAS